MREWFGRIRKSPASEKSVALAKFQAAFKASASLRSLRMRRMPQPQLDLSLPIAEQADEIKKSITNHQVVVISGETGSGKSTQLPLIAMQLGFGSGGLIGHTQPRRLAARAVASRLAQQLGSPLGTDVGFKIRFTDQTSDQTFIKLMTDGILLAEIQSDRFLDQYEMLIIDEAHERSLNIDFVLGYVHQLLAKRRDLKVIITSATIDTARFAEHFSDADGNPAPVIAVSGRTYPVDIVYRPIADEDRDPSDLDVLDNIVQNCGELLCQDPGDILVFLPTENDIRNAAKKLRGARLGNSPRGIEVLPLYARLSTEQQNLIFAPHSLPRIVLATNVAESSITVPGIRYVVDTGTARISRYAARSKVQRLPIESISQASANQRAGRCGRIAPGVCIRLYSEDDFRSRSEFTTPEIRRTNLAGTILQLMALRLGDIDNFPFLDPPQADLIRDGFKTLFEIGALDEQNCLTQMGRALARLPVDPRVGRILFAAADNRCLSEVLIIAAGIEVPDPRVRPAERQAAADAAHAQWNHPRSDFLSILKLWDFVHRLKENLSRSQLRKALEQNFLSFTLINQWQDIHRQLLSMTADQNLATHRRSDDYDSIHRTLLAGLLSSVATLEDRFEYTGAGGIKFFLWPGSGIFAAKPKWIIAGEIVETTRRYGRTNAEIKPEWIEPLAPHLVKHNYVDPHWSSKSQSAVAYENVSLFGLPIVTRRRVGLASIDPETSRDLFIEHGLVEGQLQHSFEFHQHNRMLLEEIESLAKKTRRRDLLVESHTILNFYRKQLPSDAVDVRALQRLLKSDAGLNAQLQLDYTALGIDDEAATAAKQFPDRVRVGSIEVPVSYRFTPGGVDDGATVCVPIEALGQFDDVQSGWLIPGLLRERIEALIRSLPKAVRRNLVPAPDIARRVAEKLPFGEGVFQDGVARELSRLAGESIAASLFDREKIAPHLFVNIQVVGTNGQIVAQARSVSELNQQLSPELRHQQVIIDDSEWHRDNLTEWNWDTLPAEFPVTRGTVRIVAHPAIVDQQIAVGIRLVDSPGRAHQLSQQGLVRLLRIANRKTVRSQVAWLPGMDAVQVKLRRWVGAEKLLDQLGDLIIRVGLVEGRMPLPRSKQDYHELLKLAPQQIALATQDVAKWLPLLAESGQRAALSLEQLPDRFGEAKGELRNQIRELFREDFLVHTPWTWLQHYPRYLAGIHQRADKLPSTDARNDKQSSQVIRELLQRYEQRFEQHERQGWIDPELDRFRWMIEELRISLFAQQLGTSIPISPKRLEKQWQSVRQA